MFVRFRVHLHANAKNEEHDGVPLSRSDLVFAARAEHVENHQLRIREKPLFGFRTGGSGSANQGP